MFEIEIKTTDQDLYQDIINANILGVEPMLDMKKANFLMDKIPDFVTIFIGFSASVIANLFVDWLKKRSNKNSPHITNINISNTTNNLSIDELKIEINNFYNQKNDEKK